MAILNAASRWTTNARRILAPLAAMFATFPAAASEAGAPPAASEYQIKAVFLFNFAQFVDWPAEAFANDSSPFCIGVLGDDPFGSNLDEVVRDEHVGGRTLVVKRVRQLEDAMDCQMLFISRSEARRMSDMLHRLRGRPVLTVADAPGFAENGGMIGFTMEANRVRLRVNALAAQASQLRISSKLLRSAQVVSAR